MNGRSKPRFIRLLAIGVLATIPWSSGCSAFFSSSSSSSKQPFEPTAENSDLVFVRTGDHRYYYVVDVARGVCFFHAPMYGRKHLAEMRCSDLPEYEEIVKGAGRQVPPAGAEAPAPPTADSPANTPARGPVAVSPTAPTADTDPAPEPPGLPEETMTRVSRAFAELQCGRRQGKVEDLEAVLGRHQLDMDTWEAAMEQLQADPDRWAKLHDQAAASCKP